MAATRARRALSLLATAAVLMTAAACGGQENTGSAAHRLAVWVANVSLGHSIGTVEHDGTIIDEAQAQGAGAVHTACALLVTDLSNSAAGELPSPDPEVTSDLSRAFDDEAQAGSTCVDAPGDPAALARAASDRARAQILFEAALDRVAAVTGSAPATTPTTDASGNVF